MSADHDKIKELAYRLWQQDGGAHGRDLDYWLRAEAQLKADAPKAKKAPAKAAAKPKAPAAAKAKPATKKAAAKKA